VRGACVAVRIIVSGPPTRPLRRRCAAPRRVACRPMINGIVQSHMVAHIHTSATFSIYIKTERWRGAEAACQRSPSGSWCQSLISARDKKRYAFQNYYFFLMFD